MGPSCWWTFVDWMSFKIVDTLTWYSRLISSDSTYSSALSWGTIGYVAKAKSSFNINDSLVLTVSETGKILKLNYGTVCAVICPLGTTELVTNGNCLLDKNQTFVLVKKTSQGDCQLSLSSISHTKLSPASNPIPSFLKEWPNVYQSRRVWQKQCKASIPDKILFVESFFSLPVIES